MRKDSEEIRWRYETGGTEGSVTLFGVRIFDYEWESARRSIEVRDPLHHQVFTFRVYTVRIGGEKRCFAAGEFSSCVWGFMCRTFPDASAVKNPRENLCKK